MAAGPRWLTPDEQIAWRSFLLTAQLVEESLDRQLQRDAGIPHVYYGILVALSEAPDSSMRMSDLARFLCYSQSRVTHAVNSLERNGWVRRQRHETDGRGQWAVLTDAGRAKLADAAPGHVAEVRSTLFDHLTPEQVVQLTEICCAVLGGRAEPPGITGS